MIKKYPVISKCPICQHDLVVAKLHCDNCNTDVDGSFTLSKFNYLDTEKLYFIEVFVKNRGNIKAVEKELNISYPTVKKILDEVIASLGYKVEDNVDGDDETQSEAPLRKSRSDILNELREGKITAEEAVELLSNKKALKEKSKTVVINAKDITEKFENQMKNIEDKLRHFEFDVDKNKKGDE